MDAYNLRVERITPLRLENNAVFRVETRGMSDGTSSYALRIHRPGYRSAAQTRSELRYLQALTRDTGLAVPEPVPTREGDVVATVTLDGSSEPRHCDVLTWIEGAPRRPGEGLGAAGAGRIGAFLARIHAYSERFAPPPGFDLPRWDADGLLTPRSPFDPGDLGASFSPEDRAALESLHRRVRAVFGALGDRPDEFGIIHADFILGNCLFRGHNLRVVDFDDCGYGYFLYDMAPMLGNLRDFDLEGTLARAFLAGYRSVRSLPTKHKAHLDLVIAVRDGASALWAAGRMRRTGLPGEQRRSAAENIDRRMGEVRRYLASGAREP